MRIVAEDRLGRIRTEIAQLADRRKNLMLTTRAELIAMGVEAHIARWPYVTAGDRVGERVALWLECGITTAGQHYSRLHSLGHESTTMRGPQASRDGRVQGVLGIFEVLVDDGDERLFARVTDDPHEESGHRRSVGRLRRRAAGDGFDVKVSDREVALTDPMGSIVHVGDVWSAMGWLAGIRLAEGSGTPLGTA